MKTQIGELVTADLHEGTLTIEVGETMIAQAGKYAIVPIEDYERLVNGVDESTRLALNLPVVNQRSELLLAYEKFGCTEEYWQQEGEKFANEQINSFLSQL
jgi:hypothetical protein